MRKFYSIIVTALLSLVSLTSNAVNIKIVVDDPTRVGISLDYGNTFLEGIVAGENEITVNEYASVDIKAIGDVFLTKVTKQIGDAEPIEVNINSDMASCGLYINASDEGAVYTVTSAKTDDLRDASCTVIVDNPANVKMMRSTYKEIELTEGENTVKFVSGKEVPFAIGAAVYGTELYQVTLNDEPVEATYGQWRLNPVDGDVIKIFAEFPDEDFLVTFTLNGDAKDFITSVTVDGEPVTNWADPDFTVKAGKKLEIAGNTSDYKVDAFKVNGVDTYFYGSYSTQVKGNTNFEISAHKYGTVSATIDIDNPENVVVYKGSVWDNVIMSDLVAGENAIELSEINSAIVIKPAAGCYITSVTANDQNIGVDYSGAYNVTVTDGMKIVVVSGRVERNDKFVLYIDDNAAASYGGVALVRGVESSDRSNVSVDTGYNEIAFYSGDNPFGLSFYGTNYNNVYVNNEKAKPDYDGGSSYMLSLNNGDVVKVFVASDPEMKEVAMTASSDLVISNVSVTMDRITNVSAWAATHNVLPGTEISIKPADDYAIVVKVGDEEVAANEDGAYVVTVNEATTIAVMTTETAGINEISNANAASSEVYNLQGVRMSGKLPAGIYVVNGKKVVKK